MVVVFEFLRVFYYFVGIACSNGFGVVVVVIEYHYDLIGEG